MKTCVILIFVIIAKCLNFIFVCSRYFSPSIAEVIPNFWEGESQMWKIFILLGISNP